MVEVANTNRDSAFDRDRALEALGDDLELLAELAELYLDDVDQLVDQIREAVGRRDAEALGRSAHQLKGSSSNFHAAATVAAALRLEKMGREDNLADIGEALTTLESEIDRLKPELAKLVEVG